MKLTTALKSRTVWCGVIATVVALAKFLWPQNAALDQVLTQKEVLASNLVLLAQGTLGVGAIVFRILAKARDE
jgi:hypothetical protein